MGRDQEEREKCLQDAIRELFSDSFGRCFEIGVKGLTWDALREACATAHKNNIGINNNSFGYNKDQIDDQETKENIDNIIEHELMDAVDKILRDYLCLVERFCGRHGAAQQTCGTEVEFFRIAKGDAIIEDIRERLEQYDTVTESDFKRLQKKFRDTIMDGNHNYQEKKDDFTMCEVKQHPHTNRNTGRKCTRYTLVYFTVEIEAKVVTKTWWNLSNTKVTMKYMHKRFQNRQELLTFVRQCVTEIGEQKFANASYNSSTKETNFRAMNHMHPMLIIPKI